MADSSPTRDRLINVAAARFWTRGFSSTSLAEIVAGAQANGGSLYHFFRTKEALAIAVLERHREQLDRQIFGPARERHDDPIAQIFGVLQVYRDFLQQSGCAMGCPIGNLAIEASDVHPPVREKAAEVLDSWTDRVVEMLEAARGRLPAGLDLQALARFVLTVMEGGMLQAKAQRSLEPYDASVTHLKRYFEGLLAGR